MAIENKKVFFSKRAPFYHYNNNVRPNSAHHVERYFLISLHCFNIRKTSMNAAAPSRCCGIHDCSVGDVSPRSW